MDTTWLLGWWNLVFIVPFAIALIYLGVYTLSGWTFGDADVDADADADIDVGVEADLDADVDAALHVGVGHGSPDLHVDDADHDPDVQHHPAGSASAVATAMHFLGVGRVPLSLVMMVLLMTWGVVGFGANQVLRDAIGEGEVALMAMVSVPLAAVASVLLTSGVSRLIHRFLPLNQSFAVRRHELLGSTGQAVLPIDARFGMVGVRDATGHLHQIPCRLESGGGTIAKGEPVHLVAYSKKEKLYFVLPARVAAGG